MAITTIRSTYALRIETVRQLNLLAEHWGVSKSEALRRAISEAALRAATDVHLTPAEALERLQTTDGMAPQRAAEFATQVRRERREYKRIVK
jgi:predicted DNA-binding protein